MSGVDIDLKDTKEIEEAISEKDDMEPAEVLEAVTKYKGEPPAGFSLPGLRFFTGALWVSEELFAVAEASEAKTTTVNTSYTNTTNSYVYKPPDPPEFAGLYNQGATCYMNSLLQSLFLTPELRYALYNWQYTPGRDPPKESCIPYQLQRLFCQVRFNSISIQF